MLNRHARLLAETIATLPLHLYKREGREAVDATDLDLYARLRHQPNADMTAVQFWEVLVACLLLWGNSFAEKRMSKGRIVAIDLLFPWRMQVRRLHDGSIE
ncbi:phage portal protein [Achromobacter deleyi]|uniref:phage portal protein n=1 Tax=Achromobacter deleyi TaxID=1353891 RepID=UPI0014912767|nr:phage portal protein [Achromobacter deleyi]QVQ26803.1 phage portal protein [Achromobacter deleyi]UIP22377.1 phage portal protein [Achromobacter deleyi]